MAHVTGFLVKSKIFNKHERKMIHELKKDMHAPFGKP